MTQGIPGPGRIETLRALFPTPLARFPQFMTALVERYGNVVSFRLPWRDYVLINEPALVKDILVTQQHLFVKSMGARALRMVLGDGLLTSEDPKHRQMRRMVQPAFHRERIAGYMRSMDDLAQETAARVSDGEVFDMNALMTELTLRIATVTLFGSDEGGSTQRVRRALHTVMEEYPKALGPLNGLRQALPLPATIRFRKARAELDAIVYELIARRRSEGTDRGDLLSMLLASTDAETGYRLSDEQVRDEVMTLFLAGHETTANALTWTFYQIASLRDVDERLGVAARDGDRDYTMRVVKESMRLYPPAWVIGRESKQDVTLADGHVIAAGATVLIAPLVLHRRADFFPDPNRFDPDRWLGAEPPQFAYAPFGGGARRCIGEEFAWHEAAIVLDAFARRFRFERTSDVPVGTLPLVTLRPAGPVMMRSVARAMAETPAIPA
jgi:cytochrome P450